MIDKHGHAICGSSPTTHRCYGKLCGAFTNENRLTLRGVMTLVCEDCTSEVTDNLPEVTRTKQFSHACDALNGHFAGIPRDQLVATTRQFPGHMRADVQVAVDRLLSRRRPLLAS